MDHFPAFMMSAANAVSSRSQSQGVRGWAFEGMDGKQMAYWLCERDGFSQEHVHDFDEYFVVVAGEYALELEGKTIVLRKGDEFHIAVGIPHAGRFKAGTRTLHCFGGRRAEYA
jgi:quercetin dioxygenase-like cupin family protein